MSPTPILDKLAQLAPEELLNRPLSSYSQQTGQCDCACALPSANTPALIPPAMPTLSTRKNKTSQPEQLFDRLDASPQILEPTTPLCAWLHVSDHCNLRCSYCYLPHQPADMSLATGHTAIDATIRSATVHGYRAIKLKYAGGEPLLCFPLLVDLHSYAQAQAEQHNLALDGVVLSNGTLLTRPMITQLQAADLRLMISLDGIGSMHNCQRQYADGRGSFNAVARAVELALSMGLVPDISITVSGRNAQGLPNVVAWVLERDLPFSLNFYRENPETVSQHGLQLEKSRIIKGMRAAYKVIAQRLPRRSLLTSLLDHTNLAIPHLHTCNAGRNYLVFDSHGRISKCQMDMAHPITDCQDFDPLGTIRTSTDGVQNPSVDEKIECRDCEWRYWCGGGCPLQAHYVKGSPLAKSPNCDIYKALFPEIMHLESLRLNKLCN